MSQKDENKEILQNAILNSRSNSKNMDITNLCNNMAEAIEQVVLNVIEEDLKKTLNKEKIK